MDPIALQRFLWLLGYYDGAMSGVLGEPETRQALRRFQRDTGLVPDGIYGPKTDKVCRELQAKLERATSQLREMRRWRLTYYYVAEESEYRPDPIIPVFDESGKIVATVSPTYFAVMSLEGTGRLRDGRLLNVTGAYIPVDAATYAPVLGAARRLFPMNIGYAGITVDGDRVTKALAFSAISRNAVGIGYGVSRGIPLDPFRTLAADLGAYRRSEPRFRGEGGLVPAGTRAFVLELVGAKLPDGTTHDGWCVVNDTGGAIFGAHFDVFTGTRGLKRQVPIPTIGHIWFEGIEDRIAPSYSYGI